MAEKSIDSSQVMDSSETIPADLIGQALSRTSVTLIFQGSDNIIKWTVNLPHPWSQDEVIGQREVDMFANGDLSHLRAAKKQAIETKSYQRLESSVQEHRTNRWFEIFVDPQFSVSGEYLGVLYTAIDITDQKRREATLQNLLREVSHRSKNLLAIMLGIASQTARSSSSIESFLARFTGRVQSISRSQDIVTEGNWAGATLHHLCGEQITPYLREGQEQFQLTGENILLTPSAAMYVGLALHELVTNATNFGALSGPDGHVDLTVDVERSVKGVSRALLVWKESGVGEKSHPNIPSFGQKTLEQVVPMAVEGKGKLGFTDDGIHYELSINSSQFS